MQHTQVICFLKSLFKPFTEPKVFFNLLKEYLQKGLLLTRGK